MLADVKRLLCLVIALFALGSCTNRVEPEQIGQVSEAVLGASCVVTADCGSLCQKCTGGFCVADATKNGQVCNDSNACTTNEKCNAAGSCTGGSTSVAGTVCRASAGVCDATETCTGASTTCPADAKVASGTLCRAASGTCDNAETCTGASNTCPADAFKASGTSCRVSAGVCDVAETCTGASGACPADAFKASGTSCRVSAGACDSAEACTGAAASCPADTKIAAGTVCRASGGVCDTAEACSGAADACPADTKVAAGTVCRASVGSCDVAEACTGAANACPADGFLGSGTVCRASGGVCDIAETCTGASGACPADVLAASGTVCRASGGVCDSAETCTGASTSCPADTKLAAGTVCRASAGPCDLTETCTGAANACPADALVASGTVCRASGGVCDIAESCTGASTSCPADTRVAAGTLCRASVGSCDVAESCTGATDTCPADILVASGTACRASAGVCDVAEACTGASGVCPADTLLASGTVCRASAGVCDVAEACTGASVACPADALAAMGTVCRASGGVCDAAESCTGASNSCPADAKVAAGTACRASAGVCDSAESCTGASNTCPADGFVASGTVCRATAGLCDVAEACTGGSAACPADVLATSSTVCRASGGACDVAESCTGSSTGCPADGKVAAGTVCRAASGACDAAEACTGAANTCPADAFVASGTVCRAASGVCDVTEACTGSSGACPADGFAVSGTVCRASAGGCDVVETCPGSSGACPADAFLGSGTVCRAAANECDLAESCSGGSASCPTDAAKATGTACTDDGNVCTTDACGVGSVPGLSGTYFNTINLSGATVTRVDTTVDFDWSSVSPDPSIPLTNYSVRWTGQVLAPSTGSYTFETETDDGVRLYFDGALVIDKWVDQAPTKYPYTVSLTTGTKHDVTLEFYQKGGGSVARLRWTGPSIAYAIIPSTNLFSTSSGSAVACIHNAGNPGTLCRAAVGVCDAAETCTGSSISCPVDAKQAAGAVCRASAGPCDAVETCSGASNTCPADGFAPNTTVCRVAAGNCDVAETCSGAAVSCPTDAFVSAGTACRAAMNECDQAESCTGTSGTCPADVFKATGTACSDDGNVCTSDTCDVGSAQGLSATYFGAINLSGTTVTRIDGTVDFNWGGSTSPDPLIPTTNFSARWTGQVLAPNTGSYTFEVEADDGVRFWFDNTLVVDKWIDQGATKYPYTVALTAGTMHDVKMEYYQAGGGDVARLRWTGPSIGYGIIPSANLFPSAAGASVALCSHPAVLGCSRGLTATFYDNMDFTGPSVPRTDSTIDYDWGNGSPDPAIGVDTFSARWTGQIQPAGTGTYTFEPETDDGVRLWVNGVLLVDKFIDQGPTKYPATIDLVAGTKYDIKMDYYENGGGAAAHLRISGPSTTYGPIPSSWLFPSGDSGTAGLALAAGSNNGTGDPYVIWQLSNTPGTAPVDVSAQSANTWGLGNTVMMVPAFSPDGTKLVFVDGDGLGGAGWRKGLSLFDFDQTNKLFSNRRSIANTWPLGNVMKWPAFESDSRSVVFQTSTPTELCTQCDGKTGARYGNMAPTNYYGTPGTLWSTDSTTNTGAVALTNLNTGERPADANKSYQATVLPVSAGGYRWAVFTSTRPYGNTINSPGTASSCLASQLWVSAIDDTVSGATDRSHPAFWLPNQNIAQISATNYINERAYWVLDPCKVAGTSAASICQTNEDCCGATATPPTASCRIDQPATVPPVRHCVAITPNTCSADGGSCNADKDCCGFPASHCISGVCKPPPPVSIFQDASFFREYEGVCPKGSSALWRFFDWKAVTPSDSQIIFSAQTADTSAELDAATSVVVGNAQGPSSLGWTGVDVGAALPLKASKQFLRITMLFKPSADNLNTPSLTDWRQSFSCVPSE